MKANRLLFAGLLVGASLTMGCGSEPQVSHDNRRLIESVLTAVGTKNPEWLAANDKIIEEKQAAGALNTTEYQAFREIIDLAKQGKWDDASTRIYALRDGQRVTSSDKQRVENREPEPHVSPKKTRVRARL